MLPRNFELRHGSDAQPGVRADAPGKDFNLAIVGAARRSTGTLELMEKAVQPVQILGRSKIDPTDVHRLSSTADVNRDLVKVFAETVAWSHELLRSLPIASQKTDFEKQRVIAAVLLARLIETVESCFVLASRGASLETSTMFRVFLDAYFVLANVCSDAGFLSTYFRTDDAERLKLMRAASKRSSEMFRELQEYATQEAQSELGAKVKAEKIQAFNSYAYAENVGCGDIYDSMYRLSSAAVHSNPRALEKLVQVDDEGRITHILLTANGEAANRVLYDVHCFFCKALEGICELFESDRAPVDKFISARGDAMGNEL